MYVQAIERKHDFEDVVVYIYIIMVFLVCNQHCINCIFMQYLDVWYEGQKNMISCLANYDIIIGRS